MVVSHFPSASLGLPLSVFCWYACNSFSLLEITDGTIHSSTSFLHMCKHLKTKYCFHALKKKERPCSFSIHYASCFNFLVPVLTKHPHNIWRWSSNPRVLKQDPMSFAALRNRTNISVDRFLHEQRSYGVIPISSFPAHAKSTLWILKWSPTEWSRKIAYS